MAAIRVEGVACLTKQKTLVENKVKKCNRSKIGIFDELDELYCSVYDFTRGIQQNIFIVT